MKLIPKKLCIYGQCKAVNLCKGEYCVGASLLIYDNYILEDGTLREATKEERLEYIGDENEDR
jgi:hypothetical protein